MKSLISLFIQSPSKIIFFYGPFPRWIQEINPTDFRKHRWERRLRLGPESKSWLLLLKKSSQKRNHERSRVLWRATKSELHSWAEHLFLEPNICWVCSPISSLHPRLRPCISVSGHVQYVVVFYPTALQIYSILLVSWHAQAIITIYFTQHHFDTVTSGLPLTAFKNNNMCETLHSIL